MANFRAVYAVGSSIARFLQDRYPADLNRDFPCKFRLVSSSEIANEGSEGDSLDQVVSVFLHRVTNNEQIRSATRLPDNANLQPSLFLDLHYLLTYWGSSAEAEQTILSWVMRELETTPIFDTSLLSNIAEWTGNETVQLIPTNLSLEDTLRIWDALGPKYRLSVAYLARMVRIDRPLDSLGPVVATRFTFQQGVDS